MFKLLDLVLFDHPYLSDLPIKFYGDGEENAPNYVSLIIGPNGTGKSQILLAVINIINSIASLKKSEKRSYKFQYSYKLKYKYNDQIVEYIYFENELKIDGRHYRYSIDAVSLPNKLLISSYSFNDKYPLRYNRGKALNEDYHYLGLKSTTNNIFIFNPPKEAINNLYSAIQKGTDLLLLGEAFNILELKPEIKTVFKQGRNFKFLQHLTQHDINSITITQFTSLFRSFINNKKRKRITNETETKRLGDEKIDRVLEITEDQNLGVLLNYLKSNFNRIEEVTNKQLNYTPTLNFTAADSAFDFSKHIVPFQTLRDLEIISFDRFEINKLNNAFSFDNASSGEYHILLTFLNILALIEENSLVLIDEPEISLHPNWQIRYMDIFAKIFKNYPSTHFVLASHSHFLVSELKGENSFIGALVFNNETKNINFKPINRNTFGWSAEQILLDIFEVATTRNYFIAERVGKILHALSQPNFNRESVLSEIRDLQSINIENLNDNDPMKMAIQKLLKKVN